MPITPIVTSGFAKYVYEKDEKFQPAKHKLKVILDPSDPDQEAWAKERIAHHKKAGGTSKNCPVKKGNKEWKEDEDKFYAQFKTARQPTVVDTANQDITSSSVQVYGGDKVRVMFKVLDDTPTPGAFLRLQKLQLIEKSSGEGGDFDEIEGYVAGAATEAQQAPDGKAAAEDEEDF